MKLAVVGSRDIEVKDLQNYLPKDVTELISGGARGVDLCVRRYAEKMGIPLVEILPQYERYGRAAPIRRNEDIVDRADRVIALWNGTSRGTMNVITLCKKRKKEITVFLLNKDESCYK